MGEKAGLETRTPEAKKVNSAAKVRKTNLPQSLNSPANYLLHLHSTLGNQAVQRLFSSGTLLAKPKGGPQPQQADLSKIPSTLDCPVAAGKGHLSGAKVQVTFGESSSTPSSKATSEIKRFVKDWETKGSRHDMFVHGYASVDGPQELNWGLSCNRAKEVKGQLISQGVPSQKITVFAHGETSEFSETQFSPNRRAGITVLPSDQPSCADLAEQARKSALESVKKARSGLDRLHSRWIENKADILRGARTLKGDVVCAFDSNFNISQRDPDYGVRHIRVMFRLKSLERRLENPKIYSCQPAVDPQCTGTHRDTVAYVRGGVPPIHFCPQFGEDDLIGQEVTVTHEFGHLVPGVKDEGGYAFGGMGAQLATCSTGMKFSADSDVLTRTADALAGFVSNVSGSGSIEVTVK